MSTDSQDKYSRFSNSRLMVEYRRAVSRAAPAFAGLVIDPLAGSYREDAAALETEILRRMKEGHAD